MSCEVAQEHGVAASLVLFLGLTAACSGMGVDTEPPNILLVSIDTLRADHLGTYGYSRPTSPNLDALGRRGVVFEHAVTTAPWTLPAHASLLTGRYPAFHGLQDDGVTLAPEVPTLAESLDALGYYNLAVVSHLYVSSEFGLARGFDRFDDSLIAGGAENPDAQQVVDRFLESMARRPPGPFFAFVHFFDPHWDYTPPDPYSTRFTDPAYAGPVDGTLRSLERFFPPTAPMALADLRQAVALYDGEIAYVDAQIGRLFDEMEQQGWLQNTIVILTADHGEEFKEHLHLGHGKSLFEEQLHIPLIVAGHPAFGPNTRRADLVSLIDVAPTLLELAGGAPLHGGQGLSLARPRPPQGVLFSESIRFGADMRMARQADHKLIHHLVGDERDYYDLSADPDERRPLAGDPGAGTLTAALEEYTALADRGWQMKLFARGAPIRCRATVRVDGRLVEPRRYFWNPGRFPGPEYARFLSFEVDEARSTLTFELEVSRMAGQVRFETQPRDAAVTFEVELSGGDAASGIFLSDGKRLPAGQPWTLQRSDPRLTAAPAPYRDLATGVHLRAVNPPQSEREPRLSEEAIERLRALGYVGGARP